MNTFFSDDLCFVHLLHGVELSILFHVYAPHFAKSTFADHVVKLEMVTPYFYVLVLLLCFLLYDYFVLFAVLVGELG